MNFFVLILTIIISLLIGNMFKLDFLHNRLNKNNIFFSPISKLLFFTFSLVFFILFSILFSLFGINDNFNLLTFSAIGIMLSVILTMTYNLYLKEEEKIKDAYLLYANNFSLIARITNFCNKLNIDLAFKKTDKKILKSILIDIEKDCKNHNVDINHILTTKKILANNRVLNNLNNKEYKNNNILLDLEVLLESLYNEMDSIKKIYPYVYSELKKIEFIENKYGEKLSKHV